MVIWVRLRLRRLPPMAELINDKWINIEEAAEYLGVKPATIRDWIRKGKDIPAKRSVSNGNSSVRNWISGFKAGKQKCNHGGGSNKEHLLFLY